MTQEREYPFSNLLTLEVTDRLLGWYLEGTTLERLANDFKMSQEEIREFIIRNRCAPHRCWFVVSPAGEPLMSCNQPAYDRGYCENHYGWHYMPPVKRS